MYREIEISPRLYIPIEKIRKNNYCIRSIECDITVPSSEDWEEEAATLIEAKLNYRNYSIRGFNEIIKPIVYVGFCSGMHSLNNKNIYKLKYYECVEFRLRENTLPDSDSKNYYLEMEKCITVLEAYTRSI